MSYVDNITLVYLLRIVLRVPTRVIFKTPVILNLEFTKSTRDFIRRSKLIKS